MTNKELLYIEDAFEHEKSTIDILISILDSISDEEVCSFIEDEITKHKNIKKSFKKLLESEVNE